MEDTDRNDTMPDKEKMLLQLAAGAGYPGAVKAFRMAEGWRNASVARISDGLVSM